MTHCVEGVNSRADSLPEKLKILYFLRICSQDQNLPSLKGKEVNEEQVLSTQDEYQEIALSRLRLTDMVKNLLSPYVFLCPEKSQFGPVTSLPALPFTFHPQKPILDTTLHSHAAKRCLHAAIFFFCEMVKPKEKIFLQTEGPPMEEGDSPSTHFPFRDYLLLVHKMEMQLLTIFKYLFLKNRSLSQSQRHIGGNCLSQSAMFYFLCMIL